MLLKFIIKERNSFVTGVIL